VDILHKRKDGKIELIGSDLNEESIQNVIAKEESGAVHLIVTPLGGQGFILGRGNQQLSSRILEMVGKEGIIIVATESKITSIPQNVMLIDSGNPETDRKLSGYYRIITGYNLFSILEANSWH
jgi:predicted polyphosphate/ATP-dependent NAD kinase